MNRNEALKQIAEAAKVVFGSGPTSDQDLLKLKQKVNYQTILGSHAESGGHIHVAMTPLCDYDAVSVINVLRNFEEFDADTDKAETEKENYYTEKWEC